MVKAGVPIVRIGQVLRHRSLQTTAIYARVDIEQLRQLAAPWPGGEPAMSALSEHVDEYLRARRALGVKLERHGRLLPQLVGYLEARGRARSRASWRSRGRSCPADAHPQHWASRLSIARGFAAYLQTIDPSTEIPPAGRVRRPLPAPNPIPVVPAGHPRLLETARALRPPLKAASYEALFGLLAVTGMRVGEAIALERRRRRPRERE